MAFLATLNARGADKAVETLLTAIKGDTINSKSTPNLYLFCIRLFILRKGRVRLLIQDWRIYHA